MRIHIESGKKEINGHTQDLVKEIKLLLFDLDGTLLNSEKKILPSSIEAINRFRKQGVLVGVATSRGETMCLSLFKELEPDIAIVSAGAVVKVGGEIVYEASFSNKETLAMIKAAREIGGEETEITIDTPTEHFWNYHEDPAIFYKGWGETIYTDYAGFDKGSLKTCVQFFKEEEALAFWKRFPEADMARFSDGHWYKFTPKSASKETAILKVLEATGFTADNIMSFGDDFTDIGMLKNSGIGVAMGNWIPEVKEAADVVIGSNDEDGIGKFLGSLLC